MLINDTDDPLQNEVTIVVKYRWQIMILIIVTVMDYCLTPRGDRIKDFCIDDSPT